MKKIILLLICFSTSSIIFCQKKALTETGETVILYDDGTWSYENEEDSINTETPINSKKFEKDNNSTFLLKSKSLNVGFWLNPKIWTFEKGSKNEDAEYSLKLKKEDLYGMIITEKVEVPLESLKTIALLNARSVASDMNIAKEEYRTVNGLKVLFMQMNGTIQGIKFSYYGYYFSSKRGTVQFITYTSRNLLDNYKNECENLLNGLVEIE